MRKNKKIVVSNWVKQVVLCLLICCIDFLILQVSMRGVWYILSLNAVYGIINLGIIIAFFSCIYALTDRKWLSAILCSTMITIYAIINVYVIEFHGTPLTIPEFKNTKTAIDVLHGYSLLEVMPLIFVFIIGVLFIINCVFIILLKRQEDYEKSKEWNKRIFQAIACICGSVIYIVLILQADTLVEPIQKGWHFKEVAGKYGYPLYFLTSGLRYELDEPDGYVEDVLHEIVIDEYSDEKKQDTTQPDIFLILNETFYDLALVSDIKIDVGYMGHFFEIENSISGHAVVPNIGGLTNSSEFELLTSNSNHLLPGITPFQTLDMSDTASIISNLKDLGYYTIGMHPAASSNYARNTGYSLLGFDEVYFEDDFVDKEYYGERILLTDASAYSQMIDWYEKAVEKDVPIFSYLLTIQNHGDWNTNPSEEDIVHVQDYSNKSYEEKVNEFLSCISLSVQALDELIEYFENSERPVILCMVGDHAPSFINDVADENENNDILKRATPFIIWANFPIEEQRDVMVSLNQLGPILLETAGVKKMPYYEYLYQLGKDVPVLTSYGEYMDKDGNIHSYEEETEYSEKIQKYFWLEYNNLQEESIEEWFTVE